MSMPKSVGAYGPQQFILDQILENGPGTIGFAMRSEAVAFRARCYGLRRVLQKESGGRSVYDDIVIKIVNNSDLRFERMNNIPTLRLDHPEEPAQDDDLMLSQEEIDKQLADLESGLEEILSGTK